MASFCDQASPLTLNALALKRLGRFLAFVPREPNSSLADLAGNVVRAFDHFRAPATEAEIQKRRKKRLSPAQEANLVRWGYPYVMEEFRFHLTLTNAADKDLIDAAYAEVTGLVDMVDLQPFRIDTLTLLGEAEDGYFHQLERFPLKGRAP